MTTCRQLVVLMLQRTKLSKEDCPKSPTEMEDMPRVPYANDVENLMYDMVCTRPDIPQTMEFLVGIWLILEWCIVM